MHHEKGLPLLIVVDVSVEEFGVWVGEGRPADSGRRRIFLGKEGKEGSMRPSPVRPELRLLRVTSSGTPDSTSFSG